MAALWFSFGGLALGTFLAVGGIWLRHENKINLNWVAVEKIKTSVEAIQKDVAWLRDQWTIKNGDA